MSYFSPVFALLLGLTAIPAHAAGMSDMPEGMESPPVKERVALSQAVAVVRIYQPEGAEPRAVMVLGSGDGGWTPWEDAVAGWLRDSGVCVAGVDFLEYAAKDYDHQTLVRDMAAITAFAVGRIHGEALPVIYGGWSMGAAQAVAAAAGPERPAKLAGLLLMSADHRGRYGLRESDELGITPEGYGTFALSDFNKDMRGLRVAQFHGTADFMASTAWIKTLKSPHALYLIPGANHGFDGPDESFRDWLESGVAWVLGDDSAAAAPMPGRTLPFGLSPLWPGALLAIGLSVFFLFSKRHSIRLLVSATLVMGLINLFEALLEKPPGLINWMEKWVPFGLTEQSHLPLFLSGLCLLALARGLSRRKRAAWWLTVVMLIISVLLHLCRAFDWHHMVAALVLLVPLIRWRRDFFARSDASSLRWAFRLALFIASGLFVFGSVGLHQYAERGEFGEPQRWGECARASFMACMLQRTRLDEDGSRSARNFLQNLRGSSLLGGFLMLGLILRPVLQSRQPHATSGERERVRRLIEQQGSDPMDAFALMDDKRYFFHPDGASVVCYSLWRDFAVALADPMGDPIRRLATIRAFRDFCCKQDWKPVFYCAHVSNRALYEELGFITLKVGEDARLFMNSFSLQGGKFQNLRTALNRAQREQVGFRWYDASDGVDHGIEAQLRLLSDDWLKAKRGGEMTFDLGRFDLDFIRAHGAAIIVNAEGRVQAFATWHDYAQGKGRTLDLMRGGPEARGGGLMDYLILESIARFKELGVEEISLGNAPLANVSEQDDAEPSRREKATRFLFENFDAYYGYKSLFSFKKKYHPVWQGRYLAYPAGVPLPMVGLAVAGVHLPSGFRALLKS